MRELKFRAFKNGVMSQGFTLAEIVKHTNGFSLGDEPIMQYTGLIDKNGKEIYEGDIVEFNDGNIGPIRYVIGYDEKQVAFTAKILGRDPYAHLASAINAYTWCKRPRFIEVIGNIHKSKELSHV